ncbi:MAG: hypothetical protein J0I99_15270 [Devosia sp.]|uniref:hypothetical protein n=1 Tax=Devosia sp. TaxID=1871048 RepID=UPI001AD5BD0D|nr:hypothetical protein [Devosia sp.]MBN9308717.1 hypothetical protein [Devosia sp.]MBN9317102.1 hypothetical protein [Devosia sp.]
MREIERALAAATLVGSLINGFRHDLAWFLLIGAAFGLYIVLADRALRRRIGPRHWPSEGFARFTFNTNLYFAVRNLLVGALVFALAGSAAGLVGL